MWQKNRLDGVEWGQELGSRWVGRISSVLEFTWLLWGAPGLSSHDLMPQNIWQWYPVSSYAVGPLVLCEVSFEHNLLDDSMGVSGVVVHTYCAQHSEMSGFIRNSLIHCGAHWALCFCFNLKVSLLWKGNLEVASSSLLESKHHEGPVTDSVFTLQPPNCTWHAGGTRYLFLDSWIDKWIYPIA